MSTSCIVTFALILGCCVAALAQAPSNRVTAQIDKPQVTTLFGNVHPMARADFNGGVVSADMPLQHMIFQQ